jgi:hypothetical protein
MEALLEGSRSSGKMTNICKVTSEVYPENSKAGLKTLETDVITFEKSSDKMEAISLEANPGATKAAVEWQELHERLVLQCRRWVKKQIQESVGSWQKLSAAWK